MLLTKSKFLIGLQCPVWFWKSMNTPKDLPQIDPKTQSTLDQGSEVGLLAQSLFPDGISISTSDFKINLIKTRAFLKTHKPLFEAGFQENDLYARIDILQPIEDQFTIVEVKSSTNIKEEHLYDLAFQKHVLEQQINIDKTLLITINKDYVRKGTLRLTELFVMTDLTEQVDALLPKIPALIQQQKILLNHPCPTPTLTNQCRALYPCPVHQPLLQALPKGNIFELYYARGKDDLLYDQGFHSLKEVPHDEALLTPKQKLQVQAAKTGKPHVDKEHLKEWLSSLTYPLAYLDFETFANAIPPYDNTSPYQQVPFQYSLHLQQEDGSIQHQAFLHDGKDDPRPAFANSLKEALKDAQTILVYYQPFEQGRLQELAKAYPEHDEWIAEAIKKLKDLLVPFSEFWYYNPSQEGSCSLKKTYPAITGHNAYKDLSIHEGGTASSEYARITFTEVTEEDKAKVRKDLLDYCHLDTEAMVEIVQALKKISG